MVSVKNNKQLNLYRNDELVNFFAMDFHQNYWITIHFPQTIQNYLFRISVTQTHYSRKSTVNFFFSYYTQQDFDKIFGSDIEKKQIIVREDPHFRYSDSLTATS